MAERDDTSEFRPMTPQERAQAGLKNIEEAIIELLTQRGEMSRPQIAATLGIESDYGGAHKGYLSGGICKALVGKGILDIKGGGARKTTYYRIKEKHA